MLAILAAVMLAAAPQHDTVFTSDGGRVLGTVVEETPQSVAIQLPDGAYRRVPRRDVVRIEYADGTVSNRSAPASPPASAAPQYTPPPPAQTPPPPPAYTPPPPPAFTPPRYYAQPPPPQLPPPAWSDPRLRTGPAAPFWLSFGLGGMFLGGDVEPGVSSGRIFGNQLNLAFEGGLRLNPHFGLGIYADFGVGGPGSEVRSFCNANGLDCSASTSRVGLLLRHTFYPAAHVTPWVAIGTGFAHGSVDADASSVGGPGNVLQYSGWEMARLVGGIDIRSSPILGVGFYAGVSFTRYTDFENADGSFSLPSRSTHPMVEAGLRLTLFP